MDKGVVSTSVARVEKERDKEHLELKQKFAALPALAREGAKVIARAFGLALIIQAAKSLRHITGRGLHEPIKIAIRRSRPLAFARSLIHLVPVGLALFEIILNWNEYYVGARAYNQALYQFLAKVHELMIQASLAAILFTFVRHELAIGEGLPFGALFSGLQLNQISYLWSMEYWGSIRSHHLKLWRRIRLALIIAFSMLLGTLCGPSSAVLLIPRSDFWPGGATHIWLNASRQQLWPSSVNASIVSDGCQIASTGAFSNECPWSEWTSVRNFLGVARDGLPNPYRDQFETTVSPTFAAVNGKSTTRQIYLFHDTEYVSQYENPIIGTSQQSAVADALYSTSGLWALAMDYVTAKSGHGKPMWDQSDSKQEIHSHYLQPYVSSECCNDKVEGVDDRRPLVFPLLLGANDKSGNDTTMTWTGKDGLPKSMPAVTKVGSSRLDILDAPGLEADYRLTWMELSEDNFQGSSIGAVILLPRSPRDPSQSYLACNIAAGWGTSKLWTPSTDSEAYGSVSSMVEFDIRWKEESIKQSGIPPNEHDPTVYFNYPVFPQIPINISRDWAELLTPPLQDSNSTIINQLMQEEFFAGQSKVIGPLALTGLMVNGLSRIGFSSQLQGEIRTTPSSSGEPGIDGNRWLSGKGDMFSIDGDDTEDWITFYVKSSLKGYAYNSYGTGPKIAIGILTVYCVFAVSHVIYASISGISSSSWDSIAEVTALAMNSAPTALLRNTCAGISEFHIFKLPVRILATKDEEGEGEHLELVFGSVPEERQERGLIEPNRTYGTMAKAKAKLY